MKKELIGEFVGTFILVLFGCGAVASAISLGTFSSLLEVATIWGAGVALAIYLTRGYSHAHLNPAVTFAFWTSGNLPTKKVIPYCILQLLGAICAGFIIFWLFDTPLGILESQKGVVRGEAGSNISAMAFGEFFPNPALEAKLEVNWLKASLIEMGGTFLCSHIAFSNPVQSIKI